MNAKMVLSWCRRTICILTINLISNETPTVSKTQLGNFNNQRLEMNIISRTIKYYYGTLSAEF
jgi:hypothetical protein